jgi:cystathionine beta-lyase/cystathionine gamma-synthase
LCWLNEGIQRRRVCYPARLHPMRIAWQTQMTGAGGSLIALTLADTAAAERFICWAAC